MSQGLTGKFTEHFQGGEPFYLNTLVHLRDAAKERAVAMVKGFLPDGITFCIITGCEYDTGTGLLSPGAIYYEGDFYRVDEQTIADSPSLHFQVQPEEVTQTYTYLDTNNRDVLRVKRMQLFNGLAEIPFKDDPLANPPVVGIKYLWEYLRDKMDIVNFIGLQDYDQFTNYYTQTQIDNFFAAFRDGYDPTFQINPSNSHLEWAYASPSHPDTPGTGANPWVDLGLISIELPALLGTFAASLVPTPPTSPQVGIELPNSPYDTLISTHEVIDFTSGTIDNPNGFFVNGTTFSAPISGTYTFRLEDVAFKLNDVIQANNAVDSRLSISNPSFLIPYLGYKVNNGAVIEDFDNANPPLKLKEPILFVGTPVTGAPFPYIPNNGDILFMPNIPRDFEVTLSAGDIFEMCLFLKVPNNYTDILGNYYSNSTSGSISGDPWKYVLAQEAFRLYTLHTIQWSLVSAV